jgi:diguanylate cyclase (GGDEF)-like protein
MEPESRDSEKLRRILYADDIAAHVEFVQAFLQGEGYEVHVARDGQEAVEKAEAVQPDLVLLDILMPKMSGIEACRIIKAAAGEKFLPVILVTVKTDIDSKVEGLRIGADDYLTRPFEKEELLARIESMLRIKSLQDRIREAKRELEDLIITDRLTGLYNQRYLQQRLHDEFRRAERYSEPLSCLLIDIDHFHRVNEELGHDFGDRLLRELAKIVRACVRDVDILTRYGGEEFMILLPNTHFSGSLTVAERIWKEVQNHVFSQGERQAQITVSIGISFYPSREIHSKDDLLKSAEEALYRAKEMGRNKICLYQQFNYFYQPS